jgi:hypothetical protein
MEAMIPALTMMYTGPNRSSKRRQAEVDKEETEVTEPKEVVESEDDVGVCACAYSNRHHLLLYLYLILSHLISSYPYLIDHHLCACLVAVGRHSV